MEILNKIQKELKAPKGNTNSFGNYKYRSCEDILEAVKPLLGTAVLTISDEIVMLGDRFYVKATAILSQIIDGKVHEVSTSAYARETLDKKGMDSAQITGATSSYARKYALNGLFCIDDTKDADTQDNTVKATVAPLATTVDPVSAAKKAIDEADDIESLKMVEKQVMASKKLTSENKTELTKLLTEKLTTFDPLK